MNPICKESIFVSIAAFCDPFLPFTIKSLFAEASTPEALVLGVVDQGAEPLSEWLGRQPFADQVRYLHIDPLHSRGVCWARHLAQSLYDDESYFLQIDSHTWFSPHWDDALRTQIHLLKTLCEKPLLSIYPPGFEFDDSGHPVKRTSLSQSVAVLNVKPDQALTAENPVLKFRVEYQRLPAGKDGGQVDSLYYALGFHIAGGFIFTLGQFVREVPYDPRFYFHGEEQGLALRAFTHGWELFHPQFHRVPLFHLYKTPGRASPSQHWREDLEVRRTIKWFERRRQARQRLNELLAGGVDPPYALGGERSLEAFIERSGIDYSRLEIKPMKLSVVKVPATSRKPTGSL